MKSNTEKIEDALRNYAYFLSNHKEYGEYFNYEKYARQQFKEKGHGFVFLEVSDFVRGFIEGDSGEVEVLHKYALLDSIKNKELIASINLEEIIQYDPQKHYATFLLVDTEKLPPALSFGTKRHIMLVGQMPVTQAVTPSRITTTQIRKRLNRMAQQGVRLLVLDTTEPDCMGPNLGKWLSELKVLEEQGKHFSVVVDSDEESAALIPASVKSRLATLNVK